MEFTLYFFPVWGSRFPFRGPALAIDAKTDHEPQVTGTRHAGATVDKAGKQTVRGGGLG